MPRTAPGPRAQRGRVPAIFARTGPIPHSVTAAPEGPGAIRACDSRRLESCTQAEYLRSFPGTETGGYETLESGSSVKPSFIDVAGLGSITGNSFTYFEGASRAFRAGLALRCCAARTGSLRAE